MLQGNAGGTRGHWWPRGRPTTGLVGSTPASRAKLGQPSDSHGRLEPSPKQLLWREHLYDIRWDSDTQEVVDLWAKEARGYDVRGNTSRGSAAITRRHAGHAVRWQPAAEHDHGHERRRPIRRATGERRHRAGAVDPVPEHLDLQRDHDGHRDVPERAADLPDRPAGDQRDAPGVERRGGSRRRSGQLCWLELPGQLQGADQRRGRTARHPGCRQSGVALGGDHAERDRIWWRGDLHRHSGPRRHVRGRRHLHEQERHLGHLDQGDFPRRHDAARVDREWTDARNVRRGRERERVWPDRLGRRRRRSPARWAPRRTITASRSGRRPRRSARR